MKSKTITIETTLKPNGQPMGTFLLSIDDGFVEYVYPLRPRAKGVSIDCLHKRICKALGAKKCIGEIRKEVI